PACAPCRSRRRAALARGLQPLVARGARLGEQALERGAVAGCDEALNLAELGAVAAELGEQSLAIGEADVAPHFRTARGDAREVAEAAGGEGEELLGVRPPRDIVHQCIGEHMRQMADRREERVVLLGREAPITSHFVLPASVTTHAGGSVGARAAKIDGNCATGAATSTRSASRAAAPASAAMASIRPRCLASSRFSRLRPTPVTCVTL